MVTRRNEPPPRGFSNHDSVENDVDVVPRRFVDLQPSGKLERRKHCSHRDFFSACRFDTLFECFKTSLENPYDTRSYRNVQWAFEWRRANGLEIDRNGGAR